jgi:hypothetical protein
MKILYNPDTETLNVILMDNVGVYESNEDKPGVILDYDRNAILSHLKFSTNSEASHRYRQGRFSNWLNDRRSGTKSLHREKGVCERRSFNSDDFAIALERVVENRAELKTDLFIIQLSEVTRERSLRHQVLPLYFYLLPSTTSLLP